MQVGTMEAGSKPTNFTADLTLTSGDYGATPGKSAPRGSRPKHMSNCIICARKTPHIIQQCCNIFDENSLTTASHSPVSQKLEAILGVALSKSNARSHMVCKNCFKQLNKVDRLEVTLKTVKDEMRSKYESETFWKKLESENIDCEQDSLEENMHHHLIEDLPELQQTEGKLPESCRRPSRNDSSDCEEEVETSECEGCVDGHVKEDSEFDFDEEGEDEEEDEEGEHGDDSSNGRSNSVVTIDPAPAERKGRLKCQKCPHSFVWSKLLSDHMSMAHNIEMYSCEVCLAEFDKSSLLMSHLEEHAAKEDRFICCPCDRSFQDLHKYQDHAKRHWYRRYGCSRCGRKFYNRRMLQEHENAHDSVRPYQCPNCPKAYSIRTCWKAHLKIHQVDVEPSNCQSCGKAFLNVHLLKQHRRTHAYDRNYVVCEQCGQAFTAPYTLEVHCQSVHCDKRRFLCDACGKTFNRKDYYDAHLRTHSGERPFQCELCGSRFSQLPNLKSHKRAVHYNDRRYHCETCNIGFNRQRLLEHHNNRVHTGERPYKCDQCDSKFMSANVLSHHLKSHTGEKPHKCEICGKTFIARSNRNNHRFTHSDTKLYECKGCGKSYMSKTQILNHMRNQGHSQDIIVVNQLQIPHHHVEGAAPPKLRIKKYDVEVGKESTIEALTVIEADSDDEGILVIIDEAQLEAMNEEGEGVTVDGTAEAEVPVKEGVAVDGTAEAEVPVKQGEENLTIVNTEAGEVGDFPEVPEVEVPVKEGDTPIEITEEGEVGVVERAGEEGEFRIWCEDLGQFVEFSLV